MERSGLGDETYLPIGLLLPALCLAYRERSSGVKL